MKSAMTATETPICSPRTRSFNSLADHGRLVSASIIAITSARLPSGRALSRCPPLLRCRRGRLLPRTPVGRQALSQRVHQVHDVRSLRLLRPLDRLAGLLLLEEVLEGALVLVLELLGVEVPRLGVDDVSGQVKH